MTDQQLQLQQYIENHPKMEFEYWRQGRTPVFTVEKGECKVELYKEINDKLGMHFPTNKEVCRCDKCYPDGFKPIVHKV